MPRTRQVLRVGYSTRRHEISKEDIDNEIFKKLSNRRDIRRSIVNKLFRLLSDGKHFDSPLVVNQRGKDMHTIDGNHRLEAIEKYLNANPTHRVEVVLNVYDNLTDQEEKDLFTAANSVRNQSTNDIVKQYADEIDILKQMQKSFSYPITIYGGTNALCFYKLVSAYLACKEPVFQGGYVGSPWNFVEKAKGLNKEDVKLMSAFIMDFKTAFGAIKNNRFIRTTPFTAIMRIWVDNRQQIAMHKMINLFKLRLVNDAVADQLGSMSGMTSCKYVREKYLELINMGRSRDVLINGDIRPIENGDEEEEA